MTTINFGGKNHILASENVSSDVLIFGDGQGDALLLTVTQHGNARRREPRYRHCERRLETRSRSAMAIRIWRL